MGIKCIMNYLAHIYLSGENDQVKIGNFIGDYVKGNKHQTYAPDIQKGILLHRNIDEYTDNHDTPKKLKPLLWPYYKRYSGIITDLFYDHFLAINWSSFSSTPLEEFVNYFYSVLNQNFNILPGKVQNFLPYMMHHNRLLSYRKIEGITHALNVMSKNTSLPDKTSKAIDILNENYTLFNDNFLEFFPYLISFVKYKYSIDLEYSFDSQI